MMKRFFATLLLAFVVVALFADNRDFKVVLTSEGAVDSTKIYVRPLEEGSDAIRELPFENGVFGGIAVLSPSGFYQLTAVRDNAQMFIYLYLPGKDVANVSLTLAGRTLKSDLDVDNAALSAYGQKELDVYRAVWNGEAADSAKLATYINICLSSADSIVAGGNCSKDVSEFLNIWAYTVAQNVEKTMLTLMQREGKTVSAESMLPATGTLLDSEKAMFFPSSVATVCSTLPREASLSDRLDALYANYKNDAVRKAVANVLANTFLSRHDYAGDFDGGLEQLKAAVEKYGVDERFLKEYERRRATVKGTPFPAGVVLRDTNGNTVEFSAFKGKYVYIDLWASWCGPCKREIPHLQKLEKELQNKDVVFVSVSVDSKEDAWKKAMTAFDMHGNQLIDSENSLGKALNVRGIPFFVIYDKDGCLYMHDAPRPSLGLSVKELLEGLK